MLGHVYVVEDAKDLAQIVRDVTRYGGAYRPEAFFLFFLFNYVFNEIYRIFMNSFNEDQIGRR